MDRKRRKNVGLIGLGIIGSRVAAALRKAQYHVFVWNRSPRAEPNFLGSPAEVAEICDVIQLFVSDAQALFEVIEAFADRLRASHVVISSATVAPAATLHASSMVTDRGANFLEAPFTGSRIAADKGELVYLVGGEDGVFSRAEEILKASSKAIVRLGEVGAASTVKVATNMMVAANVQSLAEALALVRYSGVSPAKLRDALEYHAVRSAVIDMKLEAMLDGNYEPHFSVKHMFKDVQIGREMADNLGLQLPETSTVENLLYRCLEENWADLDFSALYKVYDSDAAPEAESSSAAEDEQTVQQEEIAQAEEVTENNAESQSEETSSAVDEQQDAGEVPVETPQEQSAPAKSSLRRLFGF
jgi:3-hydroxyisobutyrate dehydrogenase-like beta-hydroxyacid dehydrogenase